MPVGEIGRIPLSESITSRIEFNNDSYSIFPVDDWDDFRTFGFYFGLSAQKWAIELTADSLTDRNLTIAESGRVDELYGSLSRELFLFSLNPFTAELRAGGGVMLLGDFGSYALQQEVHSIYGCIRPTPDASHTPDTKRIFVANSVLRLALDTPVLPTAFSGAVEAGQTGFYRLSAFFAVSPMDGFIGTRLYGGTVRANRYQKEGSAFTATLNSENGLYAGAIFRAGILETGFSYNFTEHRQGGYAALSFDGTEKKVSVGQQHAQCIDFRLMPLFAALRVRRSILERPVATSPVFGAESGPMILYHTAVADTDLYRYEQCYLGLECAWDPFSWVEAYIMAGAGIRKEEWKTAPLTEARLVAEKTSAVAIGETGLRFFVPRNTPADTEWGLGTSLVVHYSDALVPGLCPFFQLYLIGESGRKNVFVR